MEPQAEFGPERYAKKRPVGGPRGFWQVVEDVQPATVAVLVALSLGLVLVAVQMGGNAVALAVISAVWAVTLFALAGWAGHRVEQRAAGRHRMG
ncbi:hypothetical protein ACIRBX_38435 [Kitasatospora sp. NPDC096147]|uniref:hypothetical protein n=1 Tax=Kitasatospora sp. NPDC096147 TaxID=3364093 RepID=UPI0038275B8A